MSGKPEQQNNAPLSKEEITLFINIQAGKILEKIPFSFAQTMAARRFARIGLFSEVNKIARKNHFSQEKRDLFLVEPFEHVPALLQEALKNPEERADLIRILGENKDFLNEFLTDPGGNIEEIHRIFHEKAQSLRRKHRIPSQNH